MESGLKALERESTVDVKQKVAFVIDALLVGGAEKFLITVVNGLVKRGFQPYVILFSDFNPLLNELDPTIQVEVYTRSHKFDLSVSRRVKAFLNTEGIKKVFCIDPFSFFMARWSFFHDKNITVYLSLHHTLPKSYKYFLQYMVFFRLLRRTDKILYICKNQKKYFDKTYYVGHHKSEVIYNGVDTDYFSPGSVTKKMSFDRNEWKVRLGLSADDKIIMKVAALRTEKRHDLAVEALGALHQNHKKPAHLVFVGARESDSEYVQELKNKAKTLGVADYLHFVPMQSDVRPYYMMADVFTLTSFTETFSLSALEAMSMGLPCSLTDIGGASEMIEVNKTGALSNPGEPATMAASWNTLLDLEFDSEYIRRRVVDRFSLNKMIDQYDALLN